jgi:protein-disulfide isomerase
MKRNSIIVIVVLAALAAGGYVWMGNREMPAVPDVPPPPAAEQTSDNADTAEPADGETQTADTPTAPETPAAIVREMALGAEDAPVTVIEYASFTCPHCANFHRDVFGTLKSEYIDTGKVRFVLRDVYFDRFGLWAAMVARCGDGSKYFGLTDLIFEKQKEWTQGETNAQIVDNLMKLGRLAGMDDDMMDACLKDEAKAQALVAAYQTNAEKDQITGTPSFIINGEKNPNMPLDDFRKVLDGLLAE